MPDPEILADCWEQGVDDAIASLTGTHTRTVYEDDHMQLAYQFGYEDLLESVYDNPYL